MKRLRKCRHKNITEENTIYGGFNEPVGIITEYEIVCADCGEHLGFWSYGSYDIDYYLNCLHGIKGLKFRFKLWLEEMRARRLNKKWAKKHKDDDLPF